MNVTLTNKKIIDLVSILKKFSQTEPLDPKLKLLSDKTVKSLEKTSDLITEKIADLKVEYALTDEVTKCILYENLEKGIYKYSPELILKMNVAYRELLDINQSFEMSVLPEDKCPAIILNTSDSDDEQTTYNKLQVNNFQTEVVKILKEVGIIMVPHIEPGDAEADFI